MRFRKIAVEIEAVQWNGKNFPEILETVPIRTHLTMSFPNPDELKIGTLEGVMTAQIGDYIIVGAKGEVYPCTPDIFELTYEEVV